MPAFIPNPGVCGGRKPVELITDRAKRYRANSEACKPAAPRVCNYCESKRNVVVGHIDGNEDNGRPSNLAWTCKSCNAKIAAADKAAGRGKRTRQFNPPRKVPRVSAAQWYAAVRSICRRKRDGTLTGNCTPGFAMPVAEARAIISATPFNLRKQYNAALLKFRRPKSEVPF